MNKDSDWLESFAQIDRTILFDSTWMMSSQWLHVSVQPLPVAWSHGDVTCKSSFSFPFFLKKKTSHTDLSSHILTSRTINHHHRTFST